MVAAGALADVPQVPHIHIQAPSWPVRVSLRVMAMLLVSYSG
jgi:hypothetical protein